MRIRNACLRPAVVTLLAVSAFTLSSCGTKKTTVNATNAAEATKQIAETGTKAETKAAVTKAPESETETSGGSAQNTPVKKLKTEISKYQKNNVSVEYPVISGMEDSTQQEKLNAHLKENALSVLSSYPDSKEPLNQEKDTLTISCEIITADAARVVAVYRGEYYMDGAAHPNRLFYTNTVDVKTLSDRGLRDAADPYTMAAYALADDVRLSGASAEVADAYKLWQKSATVEQYQTCLEGADFPLKKGSDGKTLIWPDSFSYAAEGELFFSIPVSHALGDYVIVEYDIATK